MNNCFHYYITPTEGTYTLTDIVYPEGYELDDAVLNMYPLSYTVTEEQVREASEWMEYGAGTEEYLIEVPIKKRYSI